MHYRNHGYSNAGCVKRYFSIGAWWERGNQNEIDIVAVNDLEKKVLFAEVKRKKEIIRIINAFAKSKILIFVL